MELYKLKLENDHLNLQIDELSNKVYCLTSQVNNLKSEHDNCKKHTNEQKKKDKGAEKNLGYEGDENDSCIFYHSVLNRYLCCDYGFSYWSRCPKSSLVVKAKDAHSFMREQKIMKEDLGKGTVVLINADSVELEYPSYRKNKEKKDKPPLYEMIVRLKKDNSYLFSFYGNEKGVKWHVNYLKHSGLFVLMYGTVSTSRVSRRLKRLIINSHLKLSKEEAREVLLLGDWLGNNP